MRLNDIYRDQTLVLAHRGASGYAPMNTIPAFELAVAQGADGIELDVHLSKDGHLIVLHDFTVDHTADGSGRAKDMTLEQLKELDAGAKFDARFAGTRIPTLDEVFEAVGAHLRLINVEIKSEDVEQTDGVEQAVADCIARHSLKRSVFVSSFNPYALRRFRSIQPEVAIGCLYMPDESASLSLMGDTPFEALHPYHVMIDAPYVQNAHQKGLRVNTWTVNDPARAAELARMSVDAIMTDYPDKILRAVRA